MEKSLSNAKAKKQNLQSQYWEYFRDTVTEFLRTGNLNVLNALNADFYQKLPKQWQLPLAKAQNPQGDRIKDFFSFNREIKLKSNDLIGNEQIISIVRNFPNPYENAPKIKKPLEFSKILNELERFLSSEKGEFLSQDSDLAKIIKEFKAVIKTKKA